ncbi:hypothetical protein H5P28_03180 [Ruficoccus amylovorans]|uniref:Carbohydrate-binding domain-containing protein n=1 Tax=Ruficoccus amylovorans TaxID=1804625 RepID=A0A842HC39_9BACT|nr:hypothetical protein [Ruficoccus amylovorans]MBC2593256.1 hypothetical protein [Ruficoccus amylovorans]
MALSIPQNSSVFLNLAQPWNNELDANFKPTIVELSWRSDALIVNAQLTDSDVMSAATADNQRMWELGDVFEAFLMIEGRDDYVELHVTPNHFRMHVAKPNVQGQLSPEADPLAFEEMLVAPVGFSSHVTRSENGWKVSMAIPPEVLGLERFSEGLRLRGSFCRYDAASDHALILSTSASHPVIAFHRPDEWAELVLEIE